MNQATKGRPEFIFLDTPLNEDLMLSCSKIISNYEEEGTHPHHLELVRAIPFEDDPELCFIARFLTNHNSPRGSSRSLKTKLEAYFLCNENKHHGIIVMIPIMRQSANPEANRLWGCGKNPVPSDLTENQLDDWIQREAEDYATSIDVMIGDVMGRSQH